MAIPHSPFRISHSFAWQGFLLSIPDDWNPLKLEGDWDGGLATLADMKRPRIGIRWQAVNRKKFDLDAWVRKAMKDEVGQLAAEEAAKFTPKGDGGWEGGMLYTEPEPPGRDLWVAYSPASGRVVQVVYHADSRDRVLRDDVLPNLSDTPADEPHWWSVFELSVRTPAGWAMSTHKLNAGDLRLTFGKGKRDLATVRQVAIAKVALARLPLTKWLAGLQYESRRHYRPVGEDEPVTLELEGGREISGLRKVRRRRRRFFWDRAKPPAVTTIALHDEPRDRLVLGEGTIEDELKQMLSTVGGIATAAAPVPTPAGRGSG